MFYVISLEVSSDRAPVLYLVLCLNNVRDDFQEWSCCLKVKLTAEGEPAAGTAFLGPLRFSVADGRHFPGGAAAAGARAACRLPSLPGRSPVDPTAEDEKRRKHTASCCVHLRVLGKARPCPSFCSLPTGCRLSLMAGDKLPGFSELWFLGEQRR